MKKKRTLNDFVKRLKQTGSINRKSGSGRPRTVRTTANIGAVDELVLRQEDAPQTDSTVRQIARETRIPDSTTVRQQDQCWRSFALLLAALPDFLVIDPVCVKRLIKSFNVLFFHPSPFSRKFIC